MEACSGKPCGEQPGGAHPDAAWPIVGAVTIGQSPRTDITADEAAIPEGCRLIEAGALDFVEDFAPLEPEPGDTVLVTRLRDGSSVRVAERKVLPLLQQAIDRLEDQGAKAVMVWCSGQMPGSLHSRVPLLFAHRAERAAVQQMGFSRIAVVLPAAAQIPKVSGEWERIVDCVRGYAALPYATEAASDGKDNELACAARAISNTDAQAVVLDCMGYSTDMQRLVERLSGKPVFIPRTLLAAHANSILSQDGSCTESALGPQSFDATETAKGHPPHTKGALMGKHDIKEARLNRAKTIIETALCLQQGEHLLIVTDDTTKKVGKLFYKAAKEMGHNVGIIRTPDLDNDGQEPGPLVAAAMKASDVALCATDKSITHTNARIEAAATGTRVVTMPGITMDMLDGGATCADYTEVERRTAQLTQMLTEAKTARIEKDGHVLTLGLEGRDGVASPGVYRTPGASGNFPSGEAYIAPVEGSCEGSVVIDGSMVPIGKLEHPILAVIEEGGLTELDSEGCLDELDILFERAENGMVAELGIGTNEAAQLCGIILEDEKLFGTVHVAFGTNTSFGGTNKADCHFDGIILKPTLYLDDTLVIDKGDFVE